MRNLFFANSVKRHTCGIKILQLGYDVPISVNDSIFAILQGFYFHETSHMRSFAKMNPHKNSKFTVFHSTWLCSPSLFIARAYRFKLYVSS